MCERAIILYYGYFISQRAISYYLLNGVVRGNVYQITVAPNNITCSCNDSARACIHILYILLQIGNQLKHGTFTIFPVKVITLIHTNILDKYMFSILMLLHYAISTEIRDVIRANNLLRQFTPFALITYS